MVISLSPLPPEMAVLLIERGWQNRNAAEDLTQREYEGGYKSRLDARQGQIRDGLVVDRNQLVPNRHVLG